MIKKVKILLAFILIATLSGCIDLNVLVKLNPDGSGTIEQQVLLSKEFVSMISSFMAFSEDSTSEEFDIFDDLSL